MWGPFLSGVWGGAWSCLLLKWLKAMLSSAWICFFFFYLAWVDFGFQSRLKGDFFWSVPSGRKILEEYNEDAVTSFVVRCATGGARWLHKREKEALLLLLFFLRVEKLGFANGDFFSSNFFFFKEYFFLFLKELCREGIIVEYRASC